MEKPPVNNCAICLRIGRHHSATDLRRAVSAAVTSPTGKTHWVAVDGYTLCGKFARTWQDV